MQADAAKRHLQAGQAIEGAGDAHRPTGVAANAHGRQTRGHRHASAAGGATRHPVRRQVPGVVGGAHQGVGAPAAKGKLGHVQLAQGDHAGLQQALHRGTGLVGLLVDKVLRSQGGHMALDVQQIFQNNGQTRQGPHGQAAGPGLVRRLGQGQSLIGIYLGEGVQCGVGFGDATQEVVGQFHRR